MVQHILDPIVKEGIQSIYKIDLEKVEFQETRKDFEGDITIVVFPLLKQIKGNPVEIANQIGNYVAAHADIVTGFNVVKGFLNLVIADSYYIDDFNQITDFEEFGTVSKKSGAIMVEYSSPNTNKPLHLGHIRNNLLGYSVAEILSAAGKKVYKTQIINDRGIHICKSMVAWLKYGEGKTPESTGLKGDKLVGNFYVKFDQEYKKEIEILIAEGKTEDEAKKQAPILLEAQEMLRKWEAGDQDTVNLWKKMNQWVYKGFDESYKELGVNFDKNYFESNTYLLGKEFVAEGLDKGIFYKKEDGSVWIDLTEEGLDEKIVLRADGTAVYMTQDIGTAIQRIKDFPDIDGLVYTVGNEQDYHFKVLFLILKKMGFEWAKNLHHLSYGMVDLPEGKMKSREGTVVDADDLMAEMTRTAGEISEELGKLDGYTELEKQGLFKTIGLGALNTYARIQSILRKANFDHKELLSVDSLHLKEKELLKLLQTYPVIIQNAAENLSPALIANFTYELVKSYNSFYQSVPIFGAAHEADKVLRVQLSYAVSCVIKSSFKLLGIEVPDRM